MALAPCETHFMIRLLHNLCAKNLIRVLTQLRRPEADHPLIFPSPSFGLINHFYSNKPQCPTSACVQHNRGHEFPTTALHRQSAMQGLSSQHLQIRAGNGDVLGSVKLNRLSVKLFSFLTETRFGYQVI